MILGARTGVDVDARIRSQRSSTSTDLAVKPGPGTLKTPDRCWSGVSRGGFRRFHRGISRKGRNLFALREHTQDPESWRRRPLAPATLPLGGGHPTGLRAPHREPIQERIQPVLKRQGPACPVRSS